jgi:hypothetical protein
VQVPVYSREGIVPVGAEGWYDIPCPADVSIDNLGFQVVGGATLYEVQFLGPNGTAIQSTTLSAVKRRFAP